MHRDNPVSRAFLGLAAGSIFLPLMAFLLCDREYGLAAYFGAAADRPTWIGVCIAVALAVALAGLARSANIVRAAGLLGLAVLIPINFGASGMEEPAAVRVILTNHAGTSGIDVSCNGVALGKMPLVLDEADFYRRVAAWNEPPSQPAVNCFSLPDGKPQWYVNSEWYWLPHDPFREARVWPPDHYQWAHSEETLMPGMAKYRYWWHFERDGFTAICGLHGFSGGGGGGRRLKTVHASLGSLQFPAVRPVVELLLEELRAEEYEPSPEWIAYVLRHRELLFREVAAAAREEPEIEGVLDLLTRAHFKLPANPTAADARRVLSQILDTVEAAGAYTDPSVESRALPWVAVLCPELVVEKFRELYPDLRSSPNYGVSRSENWSTYSASGRNAAGWVLEESLKYVQPPELFDSLVYLCSLHSHQANGHLLAAVARYLNPEAAALVRAQIRQVQQRDSSRAHTLIYELQLPEFDSEMERSLVERLKPGNSVPTVELREIVKHRLRSRRGLLELARWIATLPQISDEQKAILLLEIGDPNTIELLNGLEIAPTDQNWSELFRRLIKRPRPELDRFLLKCLERVPSDRGRYLPNVEQAILATDTPAFRERIAEIAAGDFKAWKWLVQLPPEGPRQHLDWLVPTIAGFQEVDRRAESCPLLATISTPAAEVLLDTWGGDASQQVRQAAKAALRKLREARDTAVVRRQKLADLLAGRISPQDLLTLKSYIWRNGRYEECEPPSGHGGD